MYGFKLQGGEWFQEGFHKLLSQNTKQKAQRQKNNWLFRRNNQLFIPVHKYKTEIKEIKDRENAHRGLYWFNLNPEQHPVFPETTGESTKQSTLDYLQHNQRSDLDPLKTHTSFGLAQHH